MQVITLAGTNVTTTRLGFGTAGLLRQPGRNARLKILAAAYDAGIRHFDTAPIYGLGETESLLGTFLSGCTEPVTVTTKFGLSLGAMTSRLKVMQMAGRAMLRVIPPLREFTRQRTQALYGTPRFDAATATSSLERSLRMLKRERADLFLLHECTPANLARSEVYDCLSQLQRRGLIGAFGTATTYAQTLETLKTHAELCAVVQFEHNGLGSMDVPCQSAMSRGVITHSVLSYTFASIRRALARNASLAAHWSRELDMDTAQPEALAQLLLQAALAANARGIVLVHSNSPTHIAANARAALEPLDGGRLRALRRLSASVALAA